MINLVKLELSKKLISFKPDDFRDFSKREKDLPESGDFQVTVLNGSNRFSSFQVELDVGDQQVDHQGKPGEQWYRVSPNVCAKKPPGDRTVFTVTLLRAPVRSYDVRIPVTVRVPSVEIAGMVAEETIFLQIKRPRKKLHVYLPLEELSVAPGNRCKIPALVYNLHPTPQKVILRIEDIEPSFFPEGVEQVLYLDPSESKETVFWCVPPKNVKESLHKTYPLVLQGVIEKENLGENASSVSGTLEVLPFGAVELTCEHPDQELPALESGWSPRADSAKFPFTLHNQGNLTAQIHLSEGILRQGQRLQHIDYPEAITLAPDATEQAEICIQGRRPWLGTVRRNAIDIYPKLVLPESGEPTQKLPITPTVQRLEVRLAPRIPFWMQLGGGLLLLCLLGLLSWLLPWRRYHTASVTTLTVMANGTNVVSGSSDQTLRYWQVNPESWLPLIKRIKPIKLITPEELGKSVRTLRHLPAYEDQLAVGLENGEIQIWDIASQTPIKTFSKGPDRVFDMAFTRDSEYLFSGHGSGRISLWNLFEHADQIHKILVPDAPFAISALAVVEMPDEHKLIAAGGQFNRLTVWLMEPDEQMEPDVPMKPNETFKLNTKEISLDYPIDSKTASQSLPGKHSFNVVNGRQNYITSLAGTVNDNTSLLVSADNRGIINFWDVDKLVECIEQATQGCQSALSDPLIATKRGQAIRSVALTKNGCYLASAGDDGEGRLWAIKSLDSGGAPQVSEYRGELFKRYSRANFNVVDILQKEVSPLAEPDDGAGQVKPRNSQGVVVVAHDGPDNQVRVRRIGVENNGCK